MKFLEYTPFESINYFLHHVDLGECTVQGHLEAYSCKHVGADKKLSSSLEQEILEYLTKSRETSPSPTDFLSYGPSRKTLIYLILALNHIYPDHDFRTAKVHLLFQEQEWESFRQIYESYMYEVEKEWALTSDNVSLFDNIVKVVDQVVQLADCEVYSFHPGVEDDPCFEEGVLWSFHFFFYNSKLRRIVSLRCSCCFKIGDNDFLVADEMASMDDDGIFDHMDT